MRAQSSEEAPAGRELHDWRKHLHGKRRALHDRLSEICEEFVLEDLKPEHKRRALVRELRYLLDFYQDDTTWEGVE
ncbi:MAG: hypothetical protein L0Z62_33740 [Gemmataceae bacterium]|nr:hypothetical protein [Gemmataceae bacterium]